MKLLVIRFSALGDVALCAPVIDAILQQNPAVEITFLSRAFFQPLFVQHERFKFFAADLENDYKGFFGLLKLHNVLKHEGFDVVMDLHNVLRTKILRTLFFSLKSVKIEKKRKEKTAIVLKKQPLRKLKHTTNRYADVFAKVNLSSDLQSRFILPTVGTDGTKKLLDNTLTDTNRNLIGIAPFAAHKSKEWGIEKIVALIQSLTTDKENIILLFGGKNEMERMQTLSDQQENVHVVNKDLSLSEELHLMQQCDSFLAMDSGNMHLASLVGTPVVSIWGPTHPYLGFSPLYNEHLIVQASIEELPCRPCSVYGKVKSPEQQKCAQQSMQLISVEKVKTKIKDCLNEV